MNQEIMDSFILRNRAPKWTAVSEEIIEKFDQFLPAQIIYVWKKLGFGFCEHKAIQFVNPNDFQFLLFDFELSVLDNYVFGITALGDVLIWNVPDSSVAAIWIYSLQDRTCTRLANEFELDKWFAQGLDLYGLIPEMAVSASDRESYKSRLARLGLYNRVATEGGALFAGLNPGEVLGRDVSELDVSVLGDDDTLHAMNIVDYLNSWIQAQKSNVSFREISADEKCKLSLEPKTSEKKNDPAHTVQTVQPTQQQIIIIQQQASPQSPMLMPGPVKIVTETTPTDVQLMANTIIERIRQLRFEPIVVLKPEERNSAILDSKLGGPYYYPASEQPPVNLATGEPLFLLAQINFVQLPHLKDFPENGLLQFFVDPNPFMFRMHYKPMEQISWRIVYYPELPSYMQIDKKGFKPTVSSSISSLPFSCEQTSALRASDTMQGVYWDDFPLNAMLNRHCSDLIPQEHTPEKMAVLRDAKRIAVSTLQREFKAGVAADKQIQIGGVPSFTGKDPRGEDPRFPGIKVPNVLLLQLPSADGVNWGGDNYVHFFISRKDLREKDFSRVLFDIPIQ